MSKVNDRTALNRTEESLLKRTMSRRAFLARAGVLGTSLFGASHFLAACAQPTPAGETPSVPTAVPTPTVEEPIGGIINVAITDDPASLNPGFGVGIESRQVCTNLYSALVRYAPTSFEIEPDLAESWEVSDDGMTYTFKLRQNAKFWDETPVTSADVKFSIDRQIDPSNPGYPYSVRYARLNIVERVEAPDDYTVRMILKEPLTPFLDFLTDRMGYIIKPEALLELKEDFGKYGMGTGPFKNHDFKRYVHVLTMPNPYYWEGPPELKELNFLVIPEPQSQVAALEVGSVDMVYNPDPDVLPTLEANPDIEIQRVVGSHAAYLHLNHYFEPFKDVRVRKAIDLAINKRALVDDLLGDSGILAKTPLSPAYEYYYLADFAEPEYDPEQARALLEDAGYGDGLVDVTLIVPTNQAALLKAVDEATAIQADLAKIGVDVTVETYDQAMHWDLSFNQPEAWEITMMSFTSFTGDPDNFLRGVFSSEMWPPNGWNYSRNKNEELDQILHEARLLLDRERRRELYAQAQKLIMEDHSVVLLNHQVFSMAMHKKVKGFHLHPNCNFRFEDAWVEE